MPDSNDRLTKLEERKKQIEAQIQQIKARHSQRQRKADTRRKILVGSYYLERAERENRMEELKRAMDRYLTRNLDRALFDLPPLPEPDSAPAQESSVPPETATK